MSILATSSAEGTANSDAVSVSGASFSGANLIILGFACGGSNSEPVTWPSGFSQFVTFENAPDRGKVEGLYFAWGTTVASSYAMSVGGGNGTTPAGFAIALAGRKAQAPTNYATTADAGSSLNPVTVALGGVTALEGDDVLWFGGVDNSGAWSFTAPSGYTNQQTQGFTASSGSGGGALNLSSAANVSGGATGTLTGTATLASSQADSYGLVVSLPAAGSSGPPPSQGFLGTRALPLAPLAWVIERRRRLSPDYAPLPRGQRRL